MNRQYHQENQQIDRNLLIPNSLIDSSLFRKVKSYILLFIFVFISIFTIKSAYAQYQYNYYPIPELGSCRNAKECHLYCEIPKNTPACWSYGKYILGPKVLGESTVDMDEKAKELGITFPIEELGNCSSAVDCFKYCLQPQNKKSCYNYAEKMGLKDNKKQKKIPDYVLEAAKEDLKCQDKNSCLALCSLAENRDKCKKFAKRYGLERIKAHLSVTSIPDEIITTAKSELGCNSRKECFEYCRSTENRQQCIDFGKKYGLVKIKIKLKVPKFVDESKKTALLEAAKQELGCNDITSCSEMCKTSENHIKCTLFGRKHNIVPVPEETPCTTDEECKSYCQNHPSECPGYKLEIQKEYLDSQKDEEKGSEYEVEKEESIGDFLGPSGCKTEKECKNYCEKHPDECPGFSTDDDEIKQENKDSDFNGAKEENSDSLETSSSGVSDIKSSSNKEKENNAEEEEKNQEKNSEEKSSSITNTPSVSGVTVSPDLTN